MNKPAAIYARVSSDRQKQDHTITSQTTALVEYAKTNGYVVPPEWVFQDEGYSGANLQRPGLEALRDLAAQGQMTTVLIYSPDRLSRKYAYQVLLAEELARCGVDIVFLKSPSGGSPEDQLVVQFQGMIAEYERAQIAERSRRGKRHKAQQGVVNILSGAPYGYRYVRKTDTSAAYYEVLESQAGVVRMVFEMYTKQQLNIRAIARLLNQRGIPSRTGKTTMLCIVVLHEQLDGGCTTIGVSAPMLTVSSKARCVRTDRSGKITWIPWYGIRPSVC
jgi:site-specific DNA recombinase